MRQIKHCLCCQTFELCRGTVARRRVQSFMGAGIHDVVGHVVLCGLGVIGAGALPHALHLQIQEEAFYDGVVPAVESPVFPGHLAAIIDDGLHAMG